MDKKWKILLILAGLLGIFALLPSGVTDQLGNIFTTSGPAKTVTDTSATVNTIDANYKNILRTQLLDSLKNKLTPERIVVFKHANKDSLFEEAKKYWMNLIAADSTSISIKDTNAISNYVFTSEIDTVIEVKDSTGRVTDRIEINSTVGSPIPIHPLTIHDLSMKHTRFDFGEQLNETSFTLFDNIKIGTVIGYGYGMQSKTFDAFVGVGVIYKIDITQFF
jgi:hypothetical protein